MMKANTNINKTGNKLPFSVPSGYFEQFAVGMESQISVKPVSIKRIFAPWVYLVAMFAGIFLITTFFYNTQRQHKALDADMYEFYVLSQVDQSILLDYYGSEPFTEDN